MLFQEVIYQHKKHIGVCNLYRERVKSIKTGLFFIEARVSLSSEKNSSDKVATLPGPNHHNNSSNSQKTGENDPRQIESTVADERKHKQDCWKQFLKLNSKTSQVYGETKLRNAMN